MNKISHHKHSESGQSSREKYEQLRTLQDIYDPIRSDIETVEQEIESCLKAENPVLKQALDVYAGNEGKKLRPIIVLLSAKATGGIKDIHYQIAAIAELIHTATLIHDDVLDEAEMRRNEKSMNEILGNELAILFGDFIFSGAYLKTVEIEDQHIRTRLAQTARNVCKGEILQTGNKYNFSLERSTYMNIIEQKTGALFATCASLGAYVNDVTSDIQEAFQTFGRSFGISFQIIDDYLDLVGEESLTGKSLGTDVFKGKMTLPLIQLFSCMDEGEKHQAIDIIQSAIEELSSKENQKQRMEAESSLRTHIRNEFSDWLTKYDLKEYTRKQAHKQLEEAQKALERINGAVKTDDFEDLIEFALDRKL